MIEVKGLLSALSHQEENYSIALGEKVITEVKLELVCTDEEVERAVQLIRLHGRTGQKLAGWVYVSAVEQALPIDDTKTQL